MHSTSTCIKRRPDVFPVSLRLFSKQIIAAPVNRIFLILFLADAINNQFADSENHRIACCNEAGFAEIQCIGQIADLRPDPFENQQREQEQAEMKEKIKKPESPV